MTDDLTPQEALAEALWKVGGPKVWLDKPVLNAEAILAALAERGYRLEPSLDTRDWPVNETPHHMADLLIGYIGGGDEPNRDLVAAWLTDWAAQLQSGEKPSE